MLRVFRTQIQAMTERKLYLATLLMLFAFVLVNHVSNILTFQGMDVITMREPVKILLISEWSKLNVLFVNLFPLLVVLPAGFTIFHDRETQAMTFHISRSGRRAYYAGTAMAIFIVTFLTFAIPLIIELILGALSFPLNASADPSGRSIYHSSGENYRRYLFFPVYFRSSWAYGLFFTLYISLVAGVLALFTNAIACFNVRFRIILGPATL